MSHQISVTIKLDVTEAGKNNEKFLSNYLTKLAVSTFPWVEGPSAPRAGPRPEYH